MQSTPFVIMYVLTDNTTPTPSCHALLQLSYFVYSLFRFYLCFLCDTYLSISHPKLGRTCYFSTILYSMYCFSLPTPLRLFFLLVLLEKKKESFYFYFFVSFQFCW